MTPSSPQSQGTPVDWNVDRFLRDGEPDWDAIGFDLPCSRCGYNLRMLTQPRCPECGLHFEWRAVLDATVAHRSLLFEHRVSDRPVRSYFVTLWRSLRPRHFWRQVSIHAPIRMRPLWFLLLSSVLWSMVALHGLATLAYYALEAAYPPPTAVWTPSDDVVQGLEWALREWTVSDVLASDVLILHGVLWVGLLAAGVVLCCLRQTLGRYRVRTAHILRVMAYASAPFFICWQALFLAEVAGIVCMHELRWLEGWSGAIGTIVLTASLPACLAFFVIPGLRTYLQLPRPRTLAIAAALAGFLFSVTVLAFVSVMIQGGF